MAYFILFVNKHRVCNRSDTKRATCGVGSSFQSESPDFTTGLYSGCSICSFLCNDLYCVSFFSLRLWYIQFFLFWIGNNLENNSIILLLYNYFKHLTNGDIKVINVD